MSVRDLLELATFVVTIVALPFAVWVFLAEQRKERENEEEEAYLHLCRTLYDRTKLRNLCLAGGVALNAVANGRILPETPFEELYV